MKHLAALVILCFTASAQSHPTADLLAELIRVNTSNPPGQEGKLAEFLAAKLKPLGFEVDIFPTPEAGKAHFIARLKGDGTRKPVLLAAHADVVGVEREKWTVDPFAGVIKDGYVVGRGAIDFKGGLAVFAQAVIMLAKNKVPLHRDVIFMSEADEEGGKYNTTWLAESHWDKMDCEFALNEGGWVIKDDAGKVQYISISTADKSGVNLLVTAKGTSTHSSMPRPDNAIFTLSKAMARIGDYDTQPKLIDSTREFFLTLAKTSKPPMSTYFSNLVNSKDPEAGARGRRGDQQESAAARDHAQHDRAGVSERGLSRQRDSGIGAGDAQLPHDSRARIRASWFRRFRRWSTIRESRCRCLRRIRRKARAWPTTCGWRRVPSLRPRTRVLYRALADAAKSVWSAPVTTYLFQAGTDAFAWRSRGIPVYGIYPYPISADDLTRMHGNDERVPVESLEQGTQVIYKTLLEVAAK